MSAALVLMITDGQDTQKRTEDLQQAGYAIGPAWRRRADRHGKQAINGAPPPFQGRRSRLEAAVGIKAVSWTAPGWLPRDPDRAGARHRGRGQGGDGVWRGVY